MGEEAGERLSVPPAGFGRLEAGNWMKGLAVIAEVRVDPTLMLKSGEFAALLEQEDLHALEVGAARIAELQQQEPARTGKLEELVAAWIGVSRPRLGFFAAAV